MIPRVANGATLTHLRGRWKGIHPPGDPAPFWSPPHSALGVRPSPPISDPEGVRTTANCGASASEQNRHRAESAATTGAAESTLPVPRQRFGRFQRWNLRSPSPGLRGLGRKGVGRAGAVCGIPSNARCISTVVGFLSAAPRTAVPSGARLRRRCGGAALLRRYPKVLRSTVRKTRDAPVAGFGGGWGKSRRSSNAKGFGADHSARRPSGRLSKRAGKRPVLRCRKSARSRRRPLPQSSREPLISEIALSGVNRVAPPVRSWPMQKF